MKRMRNVSANESGSGVLYAIRGAVSVEVNDRESILASAENLLIKMALKNRFHADNVVSAVFTATKDLTAAFPAAALRTLGWANVPALCAQEIEVPTGMKGVIRILLHVSLSEKGREIHHQYIGRTKNLRPDLHGGNHDHCDETESHSR